MQVEKKSDQQLIQRVRISDGKAHPLPATRAAGQVTMHPQGGGDLRLLAMFPATSVDSIRRASFARAQEIKRLGSNV